MDSLDTDVEKLETAMRLFFQTMKRPQQWARVTAQAGVAMDRSAFLILRTLTLPHAQGWRVHDLANQLGIEAPSVTRKTQELEQAGYLRRKRDPVDRRAIGLELTSQGRSACTKLWKVQRQSIAQVLDRWPAAERQQFVNLFERFSADLAGQQSAIKHVNVN